MERQGSLKGKARCIGQRGKNKRRIRDGWIKSKACGVTKKVEETGEPKEGRNSIELILNGAATIIITLASYLNAILSNNLFGHAFYIALTLFVALSVVHAPGTIGGVSGFIATAVYNLILILLAFAYDKSDKILKKREIICIKIIYTI